MPLNHKVSRIRLVLGIICIIAGIAFMIHSFLEPRLNTIVKPSNYSNYSDLGGATYRQLHPKLSEKAAIVFAVTNFETEKDLILGFLRTGQETDQREYILVTDETSWTEILSQDFSFKGIVPTEDSLESDSFVSPTYIVLLRKEELFSKPISLNLGAESKPEYQFYTLVTIPVSKDGPSDYTCPNRKRAYLLENLSDLDCFQLWMEKKIRRNRKELDQQQVIGALDQAQLKYYLLYYSK